MSSKNAALCLGATPPEKLEKALTNFFHFRYYNESISLSEGAGSPKHNL